MKTLPKPSFASRDVLAACAASVQSSGLAARIGSAVPLVETAEHGYDELGARGLLYQIPRVHGVVGLLSAEELQRLYTRTLAKKGSTVRPFYDAIRVAARNGVCPLCNQRAVKTLDHYLSKDTHPQFAVTPINLVPACSDCNKEKLNRLAGSAGDQTLHPYFDDLGDSKWLVAQVVHSNPPSVVFSISPPGHLTPEAQTRIQTHFDTFGLSDLYATQAAGELVNIRMMAEQLFELAGAIGVKRFLTQQAESRASADRNSWSAALYAGLAESAWYCEAGFRLAK